MKVGDSPIQMVMFQFQKRLNYIKLPEDRN